MENKAEMRFSVQGSAATPYLLTVYGRGSGFQIFCSCPMGQQGGKLCKHIAAILMGDISNVVTPSDDFAELKARSQGSNQLVAAFEHQPSKFKKPAVAVLDCGIDQGLDKALATIISGLRSTNWIIETEPSAIELFKRSKLGKKLRRAQVALLFDPERQRPFIVMVREGAGKTFGHLERAAAYFVEMSKIEELKAFDPT